MSDRLKGKDLLSGLSRTTTALTLIALLGCLPVEGTNSCEGAYPNQAMSGTTDVCLPINGGVPIPRAEFTDPTAVPTQEPSSIIPSHLEPVLVGGVEGYRVSGGDGVIPRAEFTDPTAVPTQEPSVNIPEHLEPVLVSGVEGYRVGGGGGVIPRAEFTDPR